MMPHDRRSTARIDTGNLVVHSLTDADGEPRWQGMAVTLDLNEFGMRVQAAEELTTGERYKFSVALGDDLVLATGRVVHVAPTLNETFEIGVEFLDIPKASIEVIRKHKTPD